MPHQVQPRAGQTWCGQVVKYNNRQVPHHVPMAHSWSHLQWAATKSASNFGPRENACDKQCARPQSINARRNTFQCKIQSSSGIFAISFIVHHKELGKGMELENTWVVQPLQQFWKRKQKCAPKYQWTCFLHTNHKYTNKLRSCSF